MFWMMSSGQTHPGWDLHPSWSQGCILEQYWLHLNFPFTEDNYIQRGKGGHRPGSAERGVGMSVRMEYELPWAQVDPWNIPLLSSTLRNTCSHPKAAPTWDHWMIKERGPPIAQDTWVQMLPRCAANPNTEVCSEERVYSQGIQREDGRTNLRSASLKARGSGTYGIKNKEAQWSEAWGAQGKLIGKRYSHHCA